MLQYIINTSIIWLACLLFYELLLRKERFHQYNRVYLLASLVAGLLLPSVKLDRLVPPGDTVLRQPTEQVYEIKRPVLVKEVPATVAPAAYDFGFVLWAVYLAGVLAGVVWMASEIRRLFRLYATGDKSPEPGCTVVETGKDHCPFSFFRIVFVRSRQDYTPAQWVLLIAHEREHGRRLHSLDNLLLIMIRIVFWFHPLSHIYYKRLRIVHEFQADKAAAVDPAEYGAFLLEQNMLHGAPALTHAFNYSPIKNRIAMLTGTRSTRARRLKYLAVIPLSLILTLFCTQITVSGEPGRKGNKVYFKGNEIALEGRKVFPYEYAAEVLTKQKHIYQFSVLPDSIPVKDRVTGKTTLEVVPLDPTPVAINGKPVFGDEAINISWPNNIVSNSNGEYTPPVLSAAEGALDQYLFSKLRETLNKLEDGVYSLRMSSVVVDENGNIAYYDSRGIAPSFNSPGIPEDIRNTIDQKLADLLNDPLKFKPALKDGKPVNVRLRFESKQIEVKDHIAQYVARGGC